MKINSIDVRHTMGVHNIALKLDTPVTIFAGGNYSGKSSLLESIRMAMGDDPVRVSLKKDFIALVTDGAKTGRANIDVDGETQGIAFPTGKRFGIVQADLFLGYVLDFQSFSALKPAERRTRLFDLTHCNATTAAVKAMLIERECDQAKVDRVLPALAKGFPAAEEFAKEQARTAKSDWKAITGESYGSEKANDWTAAVPAFDAKRLQVIAFSLKSVDTQIDAQNRALGALNERRKAYDAYISQQVARGESANRLPELRTKLEADEAELAQWTQEVTGLTARAGTGPRVGLVHDLAGAVNGLLTDPATVDIGDASIVEAANIALHAYEDQYGPLGSKGDPEAKAKLPAAIKSRDLMKRAVDNDRRDIAAIEAAGDQITKAPDPVDAAAVTAVQVSLNELREQRTALVEEQKRLDVLSLAASQAEASTKKAAAHHADVSAWLIIADALAPDGIPGEILSKALDPVNDRLRSSSQATGWFQAAISADMTITANGRPYSLLSESEKWRVDAMVAEAISHLSGLKLLMLDRADVLEPAARPELLGWLDQLAQAQEIDTAIVAITLKQPPSGLPDTMTAYWIKEGRVDDQSELAKAA